MTTLGTLVKGYGLQVVPLRFDLDALAKEVNVLAVTASVAQPLGTLTSITAALTAWTHQDDDAHETCSWDSLVACRTPLHPGPCKGWKGTLHSVSPHIWKQVEHERVEKANARRTKKIADLKAQGKPIPRKLLTPIQPKPAPGSGASGSHPANNATATPLGKVNQQADLTGGQAHTASQAINKAAGIKTNTAPLPTGPKGKKPTVAGRGPAFVITQPKVTDTYKLDKASKITPQEWDALSPGDQKLIRDELEAIKTRGFGPQQTKADQLLAKLPAKPTLGNTAQPSTPNAPAPAQKPSATPGKTSLGQATKTVSPPAPAAAGRAETVKQAAASLAITEALHGKQTITPDKIADAFENLKAKGDLKTQPGFKALVDRLANDALKQADAAKMPGLGHGANDANISTFNKQISDHIADGKPGLPPIVQKLVDHKKGSSATPAAKAPSAPATPSAPAAPKTATPDGSKAPSAPPAGPTPQAPGPPSNTPKAFPPHVQNARAVAGRAVGGAPTSKKHLDAYGPLTKADFDQLDAATQKTIRDDLANATAKFLDPKKKQAARDLLDRFGSRHPAPAGKAPDGNTPAAAAHPKGYSDPQDQLVKAATSGLIDTDAVLKAAARLTPKQVQDLDATDKRNVLTRLAFIATHPRATDIQKQQAAAYGRIVNKGPLATPSSTPGQTPSLGELHAHEVKSGAVKVAAALEAARDTKMDKAKRLEALRDMTKAQFGMLTPDEQREVIDALQGLHRDRIMNGGNPTVDQAVIKAVTEYTGEHPALHRMSRAEADYKAGKIDADQLLSQFVTARVQAPATGDKTVTAALDAQAARIAKDHPALPPYVRATLAGQPAYSHAGGATYGGIVIAMMKHNWETAPRLSAGDLRQIFRASTDDLKTVDPIHAQAVMELREHVLKTGLRGQPGVPSGSPWSVATRNAAVEEYLGIPDGGEIPRDRLAAYKALPATVQDQVRETLLLKMEAQTNNHAKTDTWIALRELDGKPPLTGATRNAVFAATDSFSTAGKLVTYRSLDPADFQALPLWTRAAISADLKKLHDRAVASGALHDWKQSDNALKVFPAALTAHLNGTRPAIAGRDARNVTDIVNYGRDIASPASRVQAYNHLTPTAVQGLSGPVAKDMFDDLDKIEKDSALPLQTRYDAAMNGQVFLKPNSQIALNPSQISAVQAADDHPSGRYSDASALNAFHALTKPDYDSLSPAFRDAIDARLTAMPGPAQQIISAKFHPQAPAAATPAGVTPTTIQANVPAHVQSALDVLYGVDPKAHTMAKQLSAYGALKGSDFNAFNVQEQQQLLSDLSFIATTAKGPSGDKARKLIDRFTPAGTPAGQLPPNPAIIPPANSVPGQVRYATPLKGLAKAKDSGKSGDGWLSLPGGKRVWGHYGAAGLLIKHTDPNSGEERYLMVQRGPAISDPGKWTFPGGASDSKETPHEGATRETIEELGLKDDQFKDALVHGDHTFSVPGSTWKYTTVAASVPTMFKPDLSSHHARLETSDAKWMTLAEIKALDTSGKLHGPIAGGLLEKNVISLYPQGAAAGTGKLGQVGRPGPVTKRLGRLTMPAGGRQSPANFNAWPHPHKKSTGKNLVGSKAEIDALRQKIKQDRALYDGKTADGRLAAIGAMQGFDDTPTVVSKAEIDRLLATGDYIEAWRGVSGAGGWSARSRGGSGGKTAADINEEMRTGTAYYGKGIFGNGWYLATQKRVAEQYSDHTKGSVVRMLIPKTAITQKYTAVEKEAQANSSRLSKAKGSSGYELSTFWDPGRWGAAKGLDGIEINPNMRAHAGGGSNHVAAPGKPAFNWLNRAVLIVQKEPG